MIGADLDIGAPSGAVEQQQVVEVLEVPGQTVTCDQGRADRIRRLVDATGAKHHADVDGGNAGDRKQHHGHPVRGELKFTVVRLLPSVRITYRCS